MNAEFSQKLTGFVMPVGNGAVGKTTVSRILDSLNRYGSIDTGIFDKIRKTNNLEYEYIVTRQIFGKSLYNITLQFLVPPGQKEIEGDPTGRSFEKVIEIYKSTIRRLDVVLFTYNLSNHDSFHDLAFWVDSVGKLMSDTTDFILLGTHLDKINEVEITPEEIKEGLEYLRKEILVTRPSWAGRCTQLEVSCVTGENLKTLLRYLAGCIVSAHVK